MTHLTGKDRGKYVQDMFTRIAHRYDMMNRLMTAGQDVEWRKQVIERARLNSNSRLLDLGAGTGDLAREALTRHPETQGCCSGFHARDDESWPTPVPDTGLMVACPGQRQMR